jgi:3-dehydroquinate synthase
MRGVDCVQLPTTLLSMVDSSVGGKTAVDIAQGKNLVGAFHPPRAVFADTSTLRTLPKRELRAGLAEVIKYGAIRDPRFFRWLELEHAGLLAGDDDALGLAIAGSCEHKAEIVARDPLERGERALLNFGHTFGHAIEAGTGYGAWLHGEAVAAGMVMAAELSLLMGHLKKTEVGRVRELLKRAGLPVAGPALAPERMLELMALDKKAAKGKTRFVVLERLGQAALRADIEEKSVRAAIVAAAQ